jgi:hypothetical protein
LWDALSICRLGLYADGVDCDRSSSAIPGDAIMIGRSLDLKTKTMVSVLEKRVGSTAHAKWRYRAD